MAHQQHTDAEVIAALDANHGDLRAAATALGWHYASLRKRVRRSGLSEHVVLRAAGPAPANRARKLRAAIDDDATTAELLAAGGDLAIAASALGLSREGLADRLTRRPDLWPERIEPRWAPAERVRRSPTHVTDGAMREALRAAGGVVTRAAAALEVAPNTIRHRVAQRPDVWPEGVPRRAHGAAQGDE